MYGGYCCATLMNGGPVLDESLDIFSIRVQGSSDPLKYIILVALLYLKTSLK